MLFILNYFLFHGPSGLPLNFNESCIHHVGYPMAGLYLLFGVRALDLVHQSLAQILPFLPFGGNGIGPGTIARPTVGSTRGGSEPGTIADWWWRIK